VEDDAKSNSEDIDYKKQYEIVLNQLRTFQDNSLDQIRRAEGLEKQLMRSKEQIVELCNEIYSLEKEQIASNNM
jgi:hypothetical protein